MTTEQAIRSYNQSESIVKRNHPNVDSIERGKLIVENLALMYGEERAEEILDLTYDRECK